MSTVKVQLKTHRQKMDGTFPIVIYVYESKPQYIYTGFSVKPEQLKEGRVVRHPDAEVINRRVEDKRAEVLKGIIPGVGFIEGVQNHSGQANFCAYLRKRGDQYKAAESIDMGLKCHRMANEIKELLNRDAYGADINMDLVHNYVAHCKKAGNVHNTVMRKVKNLRTLYRQAKKAGVVSGDNPFDEYKIKLDPVNKAKLTKEQVAAIEGLSLEDGSTIDAVRDAFLISFYCHGMRFESVCLLSWDQIRDGHVFYQMNKGKKWRAVELHEKLNKVLLKYSGNKPYVLPFFKEEIANKTQLRSRKGSASATCNAFLKIIADMAGIGIKLKFHEARHTFAYVAKQNFVPAGVIQDALGHSDSKTTEIYLKQLDDKEINESVRAVFN